MRELTTDDRSRSWVDERGRLAVRPRHGKGTVIGWFDDVRYAPWHGKPTASPSQRRLSGSVIMGKNRVSRGSRTTTYLELHRTGAETGKRPVFAVGAVGGPSGMAWLEATIHGDADHSGPSPMHSRRDALVAASDIVTAVRRLSNRVADDVVTTVGELGLAGSINVVPAEARLTIDVRATMTMPSLNLLMIGSSGRSRPLRNRENVSYDLEEISADPHTEFSPRVARRC